MFIAVEGCIGSGKTTLAKLLASYRKMVSLLETHHENPFLQKFYTNPTAYAIETELAFVLIHYHQVFHNRDMLQTQQCIADFSMSKDILFAEMNLSQEDLMLFKSVYYPLVGRLPKPDLMVCLKCSDSLILERIAKRKRRSEGQVDREYFVRLNERYESYFIEIDTPKIIVNVDQVDFIDDPQAVVWLSAEIDKLM